MKSAVTLRLDEQMLFTCKCGDHGHQFILGYNNDETEVFISVHLVREHNIFKRIWIALKYVFGRRSIYGDFDEVILSPLDAPKLQQAVDFLNRQNT